MKYTPKQYASVLLDALDGKSAKVQKEILGNFVKFLDRNRDLARLHAILREVERQFLKNTGQKKVLVESASKLSVHTRNEIEKIAGKSFIFEEKIVPDLLAGLRITLNDELLIDASAKKQISRMFARV